MSFLLTFGLMIMALGVGTHLAKSGKQAGYLNGGWGAQRFASYSTAGASGATHWIGLEEAMSLRPAVTQERHRAESKVLEHSARRVGEEGSKGVEEEVQVRAPSTEMERGTRQIIIERIPGSFEQI